MTTTKAKPVAAVALERRPNLAFTESRLARAIAVAEGADDGALSAEQLEGIVAEYVSMEAVAAERDHFAEWMLDAQRFVQLKKDRAAEILGSAIRLENRLASCATAVVQVMKKLGAKTLAGDEYTLKAVDSRGAVEVVDETAIPLEFKPVKSTPALERIRALASLVSQAAQSEDAADAMAFIHDADEIVKEAEEEARALSKTEIQKFWKEHGDTMQRVDEDGEVIELPTVPGVRKEVTTKLVIE